MTTGDGDRPVRGLARRLLVAAAVALLLGGATAVTVRYLDAPARPHAQPSPTVPAATDPPVAPAGLDPVPASPSPVPSPSRSARARPVAKPSPSRSSTSPSPSHVPLYQPPVKGMCAYVDFGAIATLNTSTSPATPQVSSSTTPGDGWGGMRYNCKGSDGDTTIRLIGAGMFPDRTAAAAGWATELSTDVPAGGHRVSGLGDDAIGFYIAEPTVYKVVVLKANLLVMVVLSRHNPVASTYEAATAATARGILDRLPRS
jgi:hypothetical protein